MTSGFARYSDISTCVSLSAGSSSDSRGGSVCMGRVFYCPKTDRYQDYVLRHGRDWEERAESAADTCVWGRTRCARGCQPSGKGQEHYSVRDSTPPQIFHAKRLFQFILKL